MSSWIWVSDGRTAVDTSELVAAAAHAQDASESLFRAVGKLWGIGFGFAAAPDRFGQWSVATTADAWPDVVALTSRAQALLEEVRLGIALVAERAREYSDWLAQASLIYAAAEGGTSAYVQACQTLDALGCSFTSSVGPGLQWRAGLGLISVLPAAVGEFRSGGATAGGAPARGALSAQLALADLTGTDHGVHARAAQVARWWEDVGAFFSGAARGVVVVAPDGRALWGSPATVSLGLSSPIGPDSATSRSGADAAVERVRNVQYRRDSATGLLEELDLDPTGSPQVAVPQPSLPLLDQVTAAAQSGEVRVATPIYPAALLARIAVSGSSTSAGEVQILRHRSVSGAAATAADETSWTVVVRGTQEWWPGSNNPQDMQSNLEVVGQKPSDQKAAVRLAMKLAGIGATDPVEFVGHSQGGAIALDLAEEVNGERSYNVVSVLTAGSPTGGLGQTLSIPVLNLENLADFVPSLDGKPAGGGKSATTVLFDARNLPGHDGGNAHSLRTYMAAAARIEAEAEHSPMAAQVGKWNQERRSAMGITEGTVTDVFLYRTARVR